MHNDIEVLAGRFGNRRGCTEEEQASANYLLGSFKSFSPFAYMDSFLTSESYFLLYAMYYTEFLIVSIIAIWAAQFATLYGVFIFVAYLLECSGVRLLSRLMPPVESQNVVAPFHVEKPKRLILVVAGYDTQIDGVLSKVLRSGYAHWIHRGVLLCMMMVIVSTASSNVELFRYVDFPWLLTLRWAAVASLLGSAMMLYVHDKYGEDVRGANNNASGVATLLNLAEDMNTAPLEHSDVWLVALGNSYGSQEGIRHVLESAPQTVSETYVINVQGVGCGQVHYLSKEGFMQTQAYGKALQTLAATLAPKHALSPGVYRGLPTPGFWPNQHGYPTLSLMGLENRIDAPHAWSEKDRHSEIDSESLEQVTAFTHEVLQALDSAD